MEAENANDRIENHSGSKYIREIWSCTHPVQSAEVDVYAVLAAFGVVSPARQHAIKKLLCAGLRGKGSELQDIGEAIDALNRDRQMLNCALSDDEGGDS